MKRAGFDLLFPLLRMIAGPIQHFFSSILDAWRCSVFVKLSEREGFWAFQFAYFQGSLQLLTSSHLRERDKMLIRAILCGGVWNGFLLGKGQEGRRSLSILWQERWRRSFVLGVYLPPLPPSSMSGVFLSSPLLSLRCLSGGVYLPAAEVAFQNDVWVVAEQSGDASPGALPVLL